MSFLKKMNLKNCVGRKKNEKELKSYKRRCPKCAYIVENDWAKSCRRCGLTSKA